MPKWFSNPCQLWDGIGVAPFSDTPTGFGDSCLLMLLGSLVKFGSFGLRDLREECGKRSHCPSEALCYVWALTKFSRFWVTLW